MKPGCDCGCNDPVAYTPEDMLRFLADRLEFAEVGHHVGKTYAKDIRMILSQYYGDLRPID